MHFIRLMIATVLTTLWVIFLPGFIAATIILWGAVILICGLYIDRNRILALFIGSTIFMLVLIPDISFISYYLLAVGVPVLLMSRLLAGRHDYYKIRKTGMVGAVIGVTFLLGLLFNQGGAGDTIFEQLSSNIYTVIESYVELSPPAGIPQDELAAMMEIASQMAAMFFPAVQYIQAILSIFIILAIAASFARRKGLDQLQKKHYSMEQMPWQLSWVVIISLAIWLWDFQGSSFIGANALMVMAMLCLYYGNAVMIYFYYRLPGTRRIIIVVLFLVTVWFFTPYVIMAAIILGLFDSLVDVRKLKKEDKKIS